MGYHNPEVNTPTIDALAAGGLKIDGFYTYKVCAPARASFLTGRFPFHLAATKTNFAYFWTLEGTDLRYTMFPERLQKAGCESLSPPSSLPCPQHVTQSRLRILLTDCVHCACA